jgi:hypothetical protein
MKSTVIIAEQADTPGTCPAEPSAEERNPTSGSARADYCALFKIYAAKAIPVSENVE